MTTLGTYGTVNQSSQDSFKENLPKKENEEKENKGI